MTCDDTPMSKQLSAHAAWAELSDGLYLAKGRCPATIAKHLDQCLGKPAQVLDAGCGTGAVLATGQGLTAIQDWWSMLPNERNLGFGSWSARSPSLQPGLFNRFWRFLRPFNMSWMTKLVGRRSWPCNRE